MTAVAGLDLDEQTRNDMLNSASDEAVRASAELAGIGALAACALEGAIPQRTDVAAAVRDASDAARLAGLAVEASGDAEAFAMVCTARVVPVFSALMRVVGGSGKQIGVVTTTDTTRVAVRLERRGDDADREALPPIVDYLLDAIGATRADGEHTLAFSFEVAP